VRDLDWRAVRADVSINTLISLQQKVRKYVAVANRFRLRHRHGEDIAAYMLRPAKHDERTAYADEAQDDVGCESFACELTKNESLTHVRVTTA
jgi:hypothetical protein